MARRPDRGSKSSGYFIGFGLTGLVLGGLTLVLVLVVLPRRYVLNAGFRESGISFPSEAAPFPPPKEVHREPPPPPPPAAEPVRGPAELFWSEVGPLLQARRYARALPLFETYLGEHPEDRGVRREYAITLQRADRPDAAALVLSRLLDEADDPGTRLLLARLLRDLGRVDDASEQYALLLDNAPEDASLALEWGRALAWGKDYPRAEEVLSRGLEWDPRSPALRVALAQVYYWSGRLDDADRLLEGMDAETLRQAGAAALRDEVTAALTPPEEEAPEEMPEDSASITPLGQAVAAVAQQDFEAAAPLYREALRESPQDRNLWWAYADVLQFGLEDLEGAREALLEAEELGEAGAGLHFRLAQLDIWTGRNGDAFRRLQALLEQLAQESSAAEPAAVAGSEEGQFGIHETAEIRALLGDLRRWEGDRVRSGDEYAVALSLDSTNLRAQTGLDELGEEAVREVEDVERPRLGGNAYSLMDSDEFSQVDLGAEGVRIDGAWVLGVRMGSRWMGGLDLSGATRDEQGLFAEAETARWWNWGTLRTGVHLGMEQVRAGATDVSFGASLQFGDLGGFRSDIRYDHGLAYPITATLQSVLARVSQDRVTANLARQLSPRWSLSLSGDAAWLDPGSLPVFSGDSGALPGSPQLPSGGVGNLSGSFRFETGASVGRLVTDDLTLGVNARALTYSAASPVADGLRLFWDPSAVFAGGLYAQWERDLAEPWRLSARLNPSLAFIDERSQAGFQRVPHVSAEAGLAHLGRRFRTSLNAFYYQGRFDGYRAYGLRLTFSARDWFGGRGAR